MKKMEIENGKCIFNSKYKKNSDNESKICNIIENNF